MTQQAPRRIIRADDKNGMEYDFSKVNNLVKMLSSGYVVKVGIIGRKSARGDKGGATNAEIGAAHEFGHVLRKIPRRSFLRMPIHFKTSQILAEVSRDALKLVMNGNALQVLRNIGASCVGVILDAFHTRGFGTWAPLRPATIANKIQHNPSPLVNTVQLQRSITFVVEKAGK